MALKNKIIDIIQKKEKNPTRVDLRFPKEKKDKNLFTNNYIWLKGFKIVLIFFLCFANISFFRTFVSAPIKIKNENFLSQVVSAITDQDENKEKNKQKLEKKLAEIEKEIEIYQDNILDTQKKAKSLKGEIYILENRIKKLNLQIKATQINLSRLNQEIKLQEESINLKELEIQQEKNLLANFLENLYEKESQSLLEITLKNNSLSEFFDEINSMMIIQERIKESLQEVKKLKEDLEKRKEELLEQKMQTISLSNIQSLQKKTLAKKQEEKNYLLKRTKGKESLYRQLLKKSKQTAAEIRSRLYELMGINKPITFGDALKFAELASQATGVREALILAVITQESELGRNIGTCNRRGDPPSKSWKKVMKPTRDQAPFQKIVKELNESGYHMNIDELPVSCPMRSRSGGYIGWGGAMGPAQFLPSTWMLYKGLIEKVTHHHPASPWNVEDAFVATALLLRDNGAAKKTWKAEWRAAMKYFAGSVKLKYRFYGDSVMSLARKYQKDIDQLNNSK